MRFKKIGVSKSIAAACLIFVLGDVTQATVVLDQSADPGPPDTAYFVGVAGEYSGQDVAQTFVPAVSGTLSSLDLLLDHIGPQAQPQPVLVDIRSASGGVPQLNDSPVLGQHWWIGRKFLNKPWTF